MTLAGAVGLTLASPAITAQSPNAEGKESGYTRGLELIRGAMAVRPQNSAYLEVLAGAHFRWGQFHEAVKVWEQILKAQPLRLDLNTAIGDAYAELGDYEHALAAYTRALPQADVRKATAARRGLAKTYYNAGKHAEAAAELRRLLAGGETSAEILFWLGRALHAQAVAAQGLKTSAGAGTETGQKLDSDAAQALEQAVRLDPRNAAAFYLLGSIYRRQGRGDLAQQALERFRTLRSRPPALDPALADRADAAFEARTAVQLGQAHLAVGDAERAMQMALHARRVNPSLAEGVLFLASLYVRSSRSDRAVELYEELLASQPNNVDALWNLGNLHVHAGRETAGAERIVQAASLQPAMAEAWELLVKLAVAGKANTDRAEELARNAVKARPSRSNYLILAEILFAAGKPQACRETLAEALKRHPGDPELTQAVEALAGGGG